MTQPAVENLGERMRTEETMEMGEVGDGAPAHVMPESCQYWDYTNNLLYISLGGGVWQLIGGVGGGVPSGIIAMWSGAIVDIPAGWALCDGTLGAPDLRDMFIVGAGAAYAVGATGGAATSDLTHTHGPGTLNTDDDSHTHGPGTLNTDDDTHDHAVNAGATASDTHTHGPGTLNTDTDSHTHGPGTLQTDFDAHSHGPSTLVTGAASATVGNDNADGVTYPIVQQSHTHNVTGGRTSLVSHDHGVDSGVTANDSHDHNVDSGVTASDAHTHGPGTLNTANDTHDHDVNAGLTANDTHDHDVDSGVTSIAGSAVQENRPPYYALAFIMRL